MAAVLYTRVPPVGRITLNRPEVLNAMNEQLLAELLDAVAAISADADLRVAVLDSACDRAFSAGIDVAYVRGISPWGARGVGQRLHEAFGAVRLLEKPVLVLIDGLCLGAGLELAISGDIVLATDRSAFGLPNINVGIPAIVEAAIIPQCVGVMGARELCFSGKNWDAAKAERRGLITQAVPTAEFAAAAAGWIELLASKSPRAMATQKDIIHKWMTTDLEAAIDFSVNTVALNWMTRDQKEGMGAFLERRRPEFSGE